jgi:hypothetical protein
MPSNSLEGFFRERGLDVGELLISEGSASPAEGLFQRGSLLGHALLCAQQGHGWQLDLPITVFRPLEAHIVCSVDEPIKNTDRCGLK